MNIQLHDLKTSYRKIVAVKVDDDFEESEHGYWILPNGDLISLNNPMSHGFVAGEDCPEIFETCMKANPKESKNRLATSLDITAVEDFNWFRISISMIDGSLNCNWSKHVTREQLKTLDIIADMHDFDNNHQYWYDGGPGDLNSMKRKIRETQENHGGTR